jgi:hypothetical protein
MLHIIGLNHRAQAVRIGKELTDEQRRFSDCLLRTIEQVRPALIAEEDSEDTLRRRQSVSIAKGIADEKGVEHRFCDPTIDERREMAYQEGAQLELRFFMSDFDLSADENFCKAHAIEIGRYFPMRERFWMNRLNGIRDVDAIFICGDLHIEAESFRKILEAENVPYRIVERGIGATQEDARYHHAIQYLAEHPELAGWTDPLEPEQQQ